MSRVQGQADDTHARPRDRRTTDGPRVAKAPLRLQGPGLSEQDLERGDRRHCPEGGLSDRARREIARRIGEDARSVASVVREFGVGWWTALGAFKAEVEPRIDDPTRILGVEAMGVDETGYLSATKDHPRVFATGIVDVRRGILLDVIEGRSAKILSSLLIERPVEWLRGVEVVTIDPFEVYGSGLSPHLDHARLVADPFHIVRLANRAVVLL